MLRRAEVNQISSGEATLTQRTPLMQDSVLAYPVEGQPRPGETFRVAPGVHWIRMPLPFSLDHVNLWLIEGDRGFTIVDSGIALDSIRQHWEEVLAREVGSRPVERIVVTHFHPDHLGLASWLAERTGAPVCITHGEYVSACAVASQQPGFDVEAMVGQFARNGLDAERQEALRRRGNGYKRGVPELPLQFDRLLDGDTFATGSASWTVMVGYGHSPEHAALYSPELGVLISGDMVLPRISTNVSVFASTPNADPLRLFLDSTARYAQRLPADTLVLPSHGRPFVGLRERVSSLAEHHAERCGVLLAALDVPRCAAEVMPVLFPRELDTHQVMFAMGETIAHLNYLLHAGRLARETDDRGIARYSKFDS